MQKINCSKIRKTKLGLTRKNNCGTRCPFYKDDPQKRECKIRSGGTIFRQTPIIGLDKASFYKEQRFKCLIHDKQEFDIFDDYELGENDEYDVSIRNLIQQHHDGLTKYGDYIFTNQSWRKLWMSFTRIKKILPCYKELIERYKTHYLTKFSNNDLLLLKQILKQSTDDEVLTLLIESTIPDPKTLRILLKDVGYQFAFPLVKKLQKNLAKLGYRWIGYDATFRICKCLMLADGKRFKVSLMTVTDEFGNFVDYELLPRCSESHEYMVPILSRVVWRSLYYGPVRTSSWMFCGDFAGRDKNIPKYVFEYMRTHFNNGSHLLLNEKGDWIYNLVTEGKNARMSQDSFHVQLRFTRDKCITKGDIETWICQNHFNWIMKCVNTKYKYIILNDKQTAFEWYNDYLSKKCRENGWRLWQIEYDLSQALSKIIKNRRSSDINTGIEWINQNINGIRRSEEILTNLFENVHETQWPHLLSRWGWYDDDVLDS